MIFTKHLVESCRPYRTPFLLIDKSIVRHKYAAIAGSLDGLEVFYAMKANPHPEVLRVLAEAGCGFEVSSLPELEQVVALGVPATRVISSNPVKSPDFLRRATAVRVDTYAFDSPAELEKIASEAPGSKVYIRLAVDNTGSDWPLSKKYGVDSSEAPDLLAYARDLRLVPYGVTFHVGSQCLNKNNWVNALFIASEIWKASARRGIKLQMLSLGGGLPIQHTKPTPTIKEIAEAIETALRTLFTERPRLNIEPGRALVGDAGVLVATVIGKAQRGLENWLYLDAGVFNALMETIQGFQYELRTEHTGALKLFTVAGPSCDSVDVMFQKVLLPDVAVGDRVYIMNAGAYTLSYASSFNGFSPPEAHVVDDAATSMAASQPAKPEAKQRSS
ncbi:MAG: type III PLP-dependent enzyme [Chloroflexi bacterium]|nr:type III PLP-dependent enzyme [Chloroflexota bacterium]